MSSTSNTSAGVIPPVAQPCPACGYCPHCGRSNAHPWVPAPSYQPPTPWWSRPWYGNGTASIVTSDGQLFDLSKSVCVHDK